MTSSARHPRLWGPTRTTLLVMTCLLVSAIHSTVATAHARNAHHKTHVRSPRHVRHTAHVRASRPGAGGARTLTHELDMATKRAKRADRILVADARRLTRCLHRHHGRCRTARQEVRKARTALADAQRRLARFVYLADRSARATQVSPAPAPAQTPPSSPQPPPSMWISVDAGGWGSSVAPDIAGAVPYVRLDTTAANANSSIAGWTAAGVKVINDISGPYNAGGVSAINANQWAANAVAWYRANPAAVAIEVLNEPAGSWFWGSGAESPANEAAYANLLNVVHAAFVKEFGSARPLILGSYGNASAFEGEWGQAWWRDVNHESVDGVTVHPYGGTDNRSASAEGNRLQVAQAHEQTGKPVYVTEVGWPTALGQPATGDSLQWSEAEQAQNITSFIDWAKSTGYVADVTIFNYRDYGTNDWYGIESSAGRHKPAYAALAAFRH
jgi:Glycosyl hydrolase catalytic core